MTNTTFIKNTQSDLIELHDMLNARYGSDIAQEIIEAIKATINATINESKTPDYMLVKVLSEMVEQFLGEAHALRAELRQLRTRWVDAPTNVIGIELRCMEADFRQIRRVWWISLKLYQPMYRDALSAAQQSRYPVRVSASGSIDTAIAA